MTHPTMFFFFFPFLSSLVSSECFQSNAKKKVFLHVDFTSSLFDKIKIIPFSYLPRSFISRIISCERSCIDLKTCDLKQMLKKKKYRSNYRVDNAQQCSIQRSKRSKREVFFLKLEKLTSGIKFLLLLRFCRLVDFRKNSQRRSHSLSSSSIR